MKRGCRVRFLLGLIALVLVATLGLAGAYWLVDVGVYEMFAMPTLAAVAELPTSLPTSPIIAVPTWTPTPTREATEAPPPTDTPGPTLAPSVTPTFPPLPTATPSATITPTATPTPRVTRSPLPFTYDASLEFPTYGCAWTGVAGQVEDLDGNPLKGYLVHVWGGGIDERLAAGGDERFNRIYSHDAAWEQFFGPEPKPIEIRVQLLDPYRGDHPPVSDEIVLDLPGTCGSALGYVVFTQNH
jgi:hypothetical protein